VDTHLFDLCFLNFCFFMCLSWLTSEHLSSHLCISNLEVRGEIQWAARGNLELAGFLSGRILSRLPMPEFSWPTLYYFVLNSKFGGCILLSLGIHSPSRNLDQRETCDCADNIASEILGQAPVRTQSRSQRPTWQSDGQSNYWWSEVLVYILIVESTESTSYIGLTSQAQGKEFSLS